MSNVAFYVGGGNRPDTTSRKDAFVAFVFSAKDLMVDVSLMGEFTKLKK